MLRTLRSCGVSARMLNGVLVIEQVRVRARGRIRWPRLRLFHRGRAAA